MRTNRRQFRRGLTLVETMISLTVSATLLASVAVAYNASSDAVTSNADFFRASQAGRISMNQMLGEVRQCESVQVFSDHLDIIRAASRMQTNEVFRRFQYNPTPKTLTLTIYGANNSVLAGPYEMSSNVTALTFGPAVTGTDWNNTVVVQHVPISMTVTIGRNFSTLSGSAGPRRAQKSY
jgi:Tfp pilus assembly protein PilW